MCMCFQQLKKAGTHSGRDGAHLDSDSSPSIFAVVKKSTHWEKYGTVLVLFVADELSRDREAVLQMLSAEGYDDQTTDDAAEAVKLFSEKEVFPDIVIIDSDAELLILQLQGLNPTVAVLVLGSVGGPLSAVGALQAGAADYMAKPLALDELVARVERHVQRQHVIKLEMEKALEDTKAMMAQLAPASLLGDVMLRKEAAAPGSAAAKASLNSVAETDFEEQMSELSDENHRLGQKVLEMERKLELKDKENRALEAKLNAIDARVAKLAAAGSGGGVLGEGGLRCQLDSVARANLDLRHKVDELERIVMQQHPHGAAAGGGSSHGQGPVPAPGLEAASGQGPAQAVQSSAGTSSSLSEAPAGSCGRGAESGAPDGDVDAGGASGHAGQGVADALVGIRPAQEPGGCGDAGRAAAGQGPCGAGASRPACVGNEAGAQG
ncbi:hypothetical protein GPECTOR_34g690 [Gonium pectorale]|uniref:Response regulatory domain-containing protein n=1 Tax=Gonium pectorale TaxID=33097 RepID=A0A150GCF1_GONPE|nr:hypothetical protein GPECTOR_34g690 [Gonium pectorale]|eukprot:KXZ47531.1 hypothetical protein GPECTOR_34g690 [Gonium pectorale]